MLEEKKTNPPLDCTANTIFDTFIFVVIVRGCWGEVCRDWARVKQNILKRCETDLFI